MFADANDGTDRLVSLEFPQCPGKNVLELEYHFV